MPKTVIMQLGQAKNPTGAMRSGVSLERHWQANRRMQQASSPPRPPHPSLEEFFLATLPAENECVGRPMNRRTRRTEVISWSGRPGDRPKKV